MPSAPPPPPGRGRADAPRGRGAGEGEAGPLTPRAGSWWLYREALPEKARLENIKGPQNSKDCSCLYKSQGPIRAPGAPIGPTDRSRRRGDERRPSALGRGPRASAPSWRGRSRPLDGAEGMELGGLDARRSMPPAHLHRRPSGAPGPRRAPRAGRQGEGSGRLDALSTARARPRRCAPRARAEELGRARPLIIPRRGAGRARCVPVPPPPQRARASDGAHPPPGDPKDYQRVS
jgi:hypothetical protein